MSKLYPQSDARGAAIPDAIANPQGYASGTTSGTVQVNLPNTENVLSIYVTDACLLLTQAENVAVLDGAYQNGGYLMLPGVLYNIYADKDFVRLQHIGSETSAQYFINVLEPWAGAGSQVEGQL